MTGIEMLHVPYRGAVDAHRGLIAGEVHVMFDGIGSALPQVEAGRLRALAVTGAARWQSLPDIPTVAEFVPNYVVNGWLGVGAPKDTPAEIIDRLNKEINAVLAEPGFKARLMDLGSEPLLRFACRFRQVCCGRHRQMGEGDPHGEYQATIG